MARKRILFVDDEPNILEGLRRMLHNESDMWDLSFADSPQGAKDLLLERPFDVVVSDFSMPGQDGIDLLVELKSDERTHGLEVILLTGMVDQNLKHEAIDLGAIDLLRKPVVKHELMARLRSALRIKGYRDELEEKNRVLEQELVRSQKVELTGLLAAGAAHDLNNMLTAIVGYTSLVKRRAIEQVEPHELAAMVAKIERAGLRATKTVQQIINFAKNRESATEIASFGKIVQECIEMLQVCIPRRIKIVFEDMTRSSLIRANETEICQVVMNLCINGVQAMGEEGILHIVLKESEFQDGADPHTGLAGPCIGLSVSDTGPGMDPEILNQAFQTCFTTKERDGCGLGLSVVERIVKNHKGYIEVQSAAGKGTTFSVCLPVEQEKSSV
jgi:signal transduction histidine kinase